MLEAIRELQVWKIFAEHAGLLLFDLDHLAAVMFSEFNAPGDAAAIVPNLCAYPTREESLLFTGNFSWKIRYIHLYLVS